MRPLTRSLLVVIAIVGFASGDALSSSGNTALAQDLAAVQVSLAGEAGEAAVAAHRSVLAAERLSDQERPAGQWHSFALAHTGRRAVDVSPRLGEAHADEHAVTLGFGQQLEPGCWWGVALGIGRHDNTVSSARLEGDTAVGSLYGTWGPGEFYAGGGLHLGRTGLDIERSMTLGTAVSTERGSTVARQFGLDLVLGWTMGEMGGSRHGPELGLSWLDQEVRGYREKERSPAAMRFSEFERNSLVARASYRITFDASSETLGIRPYAAVAYEAELNGDPVSVTAESNTMAGEFTAEGFVPPESWVSVDLGVSMGFGGQASAILGYSGRAGDGARSDHLVNVGLRVAF